MVMRMKYNCETLLEPVSNRRLPVQVSVSMFLITALVGSVASFDAVKAETPEQLRWEDKPIGALTADLAPSTPVDPGESTLPEDFAAGVFAAHGVIDEREPAKVERYETAVFEQAAHFCHHPLYFEEPNLERYGYTHGCIGHSHCCIQPIISAATFVTNAAILPYRMGYESPHDWVSTARFPPVGSCPPRVRAHPRFSIRGSLAEGGLLTGLIFLIP